MKMNATVKYLIFRLSSDAMASRVGGKTQNWAPIALADGKLRIRDHSRFLCVQVAP